MALVKFLAPHEQPPASGRFLVVAWRSRKGLKVVRHQSTTQRKPSFTYEVGPDKWDFWFMEARLLADRMNLSCVYIKRPTVASAKTADATAMGVDQ